MKQLNKLVVTNYLIINIRRLNHIIFNTLYQRCARADQPKIPLSSKIWKNPPCPAKPDPLLPSRRVKLGEKILGFFREFSGKFRVLGKFRGFFVIFREISLNLVKIRQKQGFSGFRHKKLTP